MQIVTVYPDIAVSVSRVAYPDVSMLVSMREGDDNNDKERGDDNN